MTDRILLVPGLFGFAKIGDVDYFASVAPLLEGRTGVRPVSMATPPTGPLWRRVAHLHRQVVEALAEGISRVHIVGHSTGGLDARLLVHEGYMWPGGPHGAERSAFFDRIGAVVSLSGPQKGTPIARRLRGALEGAIPLVFLASFLAKYDAQHEGAAQGALNVVRRVELYRRLAEALAQRPAAPYSPEDTVGLPDDTARGLAAFLNEIVEDHPLIHELTPYAMGHLNAHLARSKGRALPVTSFVSVAPPPSTDLLAGLCDPLRRAIYATSYEETRLQPDEFGVLPDGAWIGRPRDFDAFAQTAQDGVVPAASQTHDGHVERYVCGDHLDVVGHYPSAKHGGESLFDSGARFDDARLEALWEAIGAVIRP